MNKKIIKIIASITCGLGVATSIPFAVTSCGSGDEKILPTKLICDKKPQDILSHPNEQIETTADLTGSIKTDTGVKIFSSNNLRFYMQNNLELPEGLTINSSTGEISGTPTQNFSESYAVIKFSAVVDGATLYGETDSFKIEIDQQIATKLVFTKDCTEIEGINGIRLYHSGNMSEFIKTDSGVSVPPTSLTFSASKDLPSGLWIDSKTGQISGTPDETVTIQEMHVIASATVDGKLLTGKSNSFSVVIKDRKYVPISSDPSKSWFNIDENGYMSTWTTLGETEYANREQYSSLEFPKSITKILFPMFSSCDEKIIDWGATVSFETDSQLTELDSNTFSFNRGILAIDLSNCSKLTTIGEDVFQSSLNDCYSISLPSSLTKIGPNAFTAHDRNNTSVEEIRLRWRDLSVLELDNTALNEYSLLNTATIYVPSGMEDTYFQYFKGRGGRWADRQAYTSFIGG